MLPDRVSNPGPLTYESGVLPIALRGPAFKKRKKVVGRALQCFLTIFSLLRHAQNASETT